MTRAGTLTTHLAWFIAVAVLAGAVVSGARFEPAGEHAQHDFDFDVGTWQLNVSRLDHPLSASRKWTELKGTVHVTKVWGGRANVAEVEADSSSEHVEILSLRLYDPHSHQWSLNFATSTRGTMATPMIGGFENGLGIFYDMEMYEGRPILVRFVIAPIDANTARSEQAFSPDWGKSWEVNWINTYSRIKEPRQETSAANISASGRSHDFDFKTGIFDTHIQRLLHPLSGSSERAAMTGTVVTRDVWNGKAKLEEIEAQGSAGGFEGLTLFLFDPQGQQWRMYFANSSEGILSVPMTGEFTHGRGEFLSQERFKQRVILARVIWSDITSQGHRFQQSFSDDLGKSWEVNFSAVLTRRATDAK